MELFILEYKWEWLVQNMQQQQFDFMKSRRIRKDRMDKKLKRDNILRFKGSSNTFINQQIKVKFYLSEQSESSSSLSSDSEQSPPSAHDRTNLSIIPTFNSDANSHTPTFYIPYNRINLNKCQQRHRLKQQKYQEIDQKYILVAKPRKRPYCHSCEVWYDDYLEHLSQKMHEQSVLKHPVHKEILQLCSKFHSNVQDKVGTSPKADKQSQ